METEPIQLNVENPKDRESLADWLERLLKKRMSRRDLLKFGGVLGLAYLMSSESFLKVRSILSVAEAQERGVLSPEIIEALNGREGFDPNTLLVRLPREDLPPLNFSDLRGRSEVHREVGVRMRGRLKEIRQRFFEAHASLINYLEENRIPYRAYPISGSLVVSTPEELIPGSESREKIVYFETVAQGIKNITPRAVFFPSPIFEIMDTPLAESRQVGEEKSDSTADLPSNLEDVLAHAEAVRLFPSVWRTLSPLSGKPNWAWEEGFAGSKQVPIAVCDTGTAIEGHFLEESLYFLEGDRYRGSGSHGAQVAEIVGGIYQTPEGELRIQGVAPEALITPLPCLPGGRASEAQVLEVMERFVTAVVNGDLPVSVSRVVVNCSFWGPEYWNYRNTPLHNFIRNTTAAGFVWVAAAGNSPQRPTSSPADLPEVIGVAALREVGPQLAPSSLGGESVLANGVWYNLVDPPSPRVIAGNVENTSRDVGTSFAAPVVAGTVNLILGADPTLSKEEIENILQQTGEKLPPPLNRIRTSGGVVETEAPKVDGVAAVKCVSQRENCEGEWRVVILSPLPIPVFPTDSSTSSSDSTGYPPPYR